MGGGGVELVYPLSVLFISVYKCGERFVKLAYLLVFTDLRYQTLPTSFYKNHDFKDDRFHEIK